MRFFNIISTVTLLSSVVLGSCIHDAAQLARRQSGPPFDYHGDNGPILWGRLSNEYKTCRLGRFQSPINLDSSIGTAAQAPRLDTPSVSSAEFANLGSTVQVNLGGTNFFLGQNYSLLQYHLHTPSEHHINEMFYPLEVHFVHQADDGSLGVIGVLFELTEDDTSTTLLTNTIENLSSISCVGSSTTTGPLDFGPLGDHLSAFPLYSYGGSLTTPPCSEGVDFLISQEPLPVNVATFNALKNVMKFNARPTQGKPGDKNIQQRA